MMRPASIRWLLAAVLLSGLAGCASPGRLEPEPLAQDELDEFLAAGRDARNYGITTYRDAGGARYEFANRPHPERTAVRAFVSPRHSPVPAIRAKTGTFVDFTLLLDSSARQNWLLLPSVKAMDYRPFAPPTGEYPDHVAADIPGYAGVANKIVMDKLHVESPVFCVPPARGGFGPLARAGTDGDDPESPRGKLARSTHAVMGAALLRAFSFVRFDFLARSVFFATSQTYEPPSTANVRAKLPLRDWRGRPAVQGTLDGEPILFVLDTAGDFDLSRPGEPGAETGTLALGGLEIGGVRCGTHAALGLPEDFPARLGLGILARYAITLDYKQQRVWFEDKVVPVADKTGKTPAGTGSAPVQYRGIQR